MKTNYPAVIVSAIVYWVLGALWYALLFLKQWTALEEIIGSRYKSVTPTAPHMIAISFLLDLLIAFMLAQVCAWRGANTAARGSAIGILLWFGFVAPVALTVCLYEGRPLALFALNQFYSLFGLCIMGAILGAWKKKPSHPTL